MTQKESPTFRIDPQQLRLTNVREPLPGSVVGQLRIGFASDAAIAGNIECELFCGNPNSGGKSFFKGSVSVAGGVEAEFELPNLGSDDEIHMLWHARDGEKTGWKLGLSPTAELKKDLNARFGAPTPNLVRVEAGDFLHVYPGEYEVKSPVYVAEGGLLLVDSGAVMKFEPGTWIYSEGTLNVGSLDGASVQLLSRRNDPWGGILLNGRHVEGSTFKNCVLDNASGWHLKVENGQFKSNGKQTSSPLPSYGGLLAVINSGQISVDFESVHFNSGTANYGGNLAVLNSRAVLSSCKITNGRASQSGGGVYLKRGRVEVSACTFEGNEAILGGGFAAFNRSTFAVNGETRFERNKGFSHGGAGFTAGCPDINPEQWSVGFSENYSKHGNAKVHEFKL